MRALLEEVAGELVKLAVDLPIFQMSAGNHSYMVHWYGVIDTYLLLKLFGLFAWLVKLDTSRRNLLKYFSFLSLSLAILHK